MRCPHHYHEAEPGETEEAFCDRLVAELEATIVAEGPETVAAFIAEPVMGAGGVVVPPKGYFPKVKAVLEKYDILFIADEVICGFGRLGTPFGCDYFGVEPDMISVAKGITSGYQPLSAVLVGEKVWEAIRDKSDHLGVFAHGYTYTAHPIACAAANANLAIMERENLFANAADVGAYFQEQLRARLGDHEHVGEIRGVGLIAAVELVKDRAKAHNFAASAGIGKAFSAAALENGLIVRAMLNDSIAMSPPLVLTRGDADAIVTRFAAALEAIASQLSSAPAA